MPEYRTCARCGAARRRGTPAGAPCPSCLLSSVLLAPVASPSSAPPDRLLRYLRILNVIGDGPRARVYLAEWLPPGSGFAAVKRFRSVDSWRLDDAFRLRLLEFDHPHIATVFDCGVADDGSAYVVSEYVPGTPLSDYCRRRDVPMTHRLELLLQVTAALEYAGSRGLRHVNLKPSNIVVPRSSDSTKVLDFDTITSEELIDNSLRGFVDLPGLAAIVAAVLREGESPLDEAPQPDLRRILQRACSSSPKMQYETVRELSADLTSSLAAHVTSVRADRARL